MAQLKITWIRSCIGRPESQRRVIKSLGLHRLHHSVIHGDTPTIRGMVEKVNHLVTVEVAEEASPSGSGTK
ncbi:MAG: 50S ribosomal protein L30 [Dehalococcoidia bacterium]|mgnify:CR=1 FL=1|jgi:large subunit ribosomal protein L30|nr:50S ribosomal protein L30 [Dehalococcoidia bacterium]MDP6227835.1 50S ribosomal protein L30 [Dehalococcoidia bacterium]MDP7082859.1 50S ribosomal protein L30 [Dehalococcoidia bacterium]MDP7200146.1 50S ribosomal protein L30 [Dehalococcoidia bacterium]MDP7509681.1 50S ribosomal protein L30 [Dehalococcoidia bacterium]